MAAGNPGLVDSSLTDISLDIDNKNDLGKKSWVLHKDSIGEKEVASEKRSMKERFRKPWSRPAASRRIPSRSDGVEQAPHYALGSEDDSRAFLISSNKTGGW
jgi:hypothetical protein